MMGEGGGGVGEDAPPTPTVRAAPVNLLPVSIPPPVQHRVADCRPKRRRNLSPAPWSTGASLPTTSLGHGTLTFLPSMALPRRLDDPWLPCRRVHRATVAIHVRSTGQLGRPGRVGPQHLSQHPTARARLK